MISIFTILVHVSVWCVLCDVYGLANSSSSCSLEVAASWWKNRQRRTTTHNLSGRVLTADKLYDVAYWINDNVTFNRYHRRWRGKRRANVELLPLATLTWSVPQIYCQIRSRYVWPRSATDGRKDRTNQRPTRYISLGKAFANVNQMIDGFCAVCSRQKVNISNSNRRQRATSAPHAKHAQH